MDINLPDCQEVYTFDYGIKLGGLVSESDYVWCANVKDNALLIKNIRDNTEHSLTYHNFGIAARGKEKFSILNGKDFEYNQQRYLLLSLEINGLTNANTTNLNEESKYQLIVFKLSTSRVLFSFEIPFKINQLDVLVKNKHFIENKKNPTLLRNFNVTAVCGCVGGAIQLFDITPHDQYLKCLSNEYSPLEVSWFEGDDLTDYDLINQFKTQALQDSLVFGLTLNRQYVDDELFKYAMPNNTITATIPIDYVNITSLKYEKQIDSLIVGFNFGCFQIWNMKTMSIESGSTYGENSKSIVGFSLMQPQNDPKKCLYLMVAHSTKLMSRIEPRVRKYATNNKSNNSDSKIDDSSSFMNKTSTNENESNFEIDNDDDDETDTSFILIYQLAFERCVNIFLNQTQYYLLFENMNYCAIVFEHEFTSESLKCMKTNQLSEFNSIISQSNALGMMDENYDLNNEVLKTRHSKIISIQTLQTTNNQLNVDLTCLTWALIDGSLVNYYFSVFNLNNWYKQCLPSKMRPLNDLNSSCVRNNIYFTNYTLTLNVELDSLKFVTLISSKIDKLKHEIVSSKQNMYKRFLSTDSDTEENDECQNYAYDSTSDDDDALLSMYFDILILSSFSLLKMTISPIEHKIIGFLNKQEDLIYQPERAYYVLTKFHLLDPYLNKKTMSQPKFIPIFNYLLETSQIYSILKSLWKLSAKDTSIISDHSLKAVLDWSWSKVQKIKCELNKLYTFVNTQTNNYLNHFIQSDHEIDRKGLSDLLHRENTLLESLIQIYKQFIRLNTTCDGELELNKKLCIIESLKFYVEHLLVFNKFDMLLPPSIEREPDLATSEMDRNGTTSKNYMQEMSVNLKIIRNRWLKRREEQQLNAMSNTGILHEYEDRYPFTYLIDCLLDECLIYSNSSNFLKSTTSQVCIYPPKSINEMLEICTECNLNGKLKQVLILYLLCDLMHTELTANVQDHLLKLINEYCSTTFTFTSITSSDSALDASWSHLRPSVADSNTSMSIFDLANGIYLMDSHHVERAFKYLKNSDLAFLQFFEKYFCLYNAVHVKEYKMAIQYLRLFQKLNNASSIGPSTDLSSSTDLSTVLFRYFGVKASPEMLEFAQKTQHEQQLHLRLICTVFLSNALLSEAFELIKPHLERLKYLNKLDASVQAADVEANRVSKQMIIHFFCEIDRFKLWKAVMKLSVLDHDLLELLYGYLEAKQDLKSISMAIDLYVNNKNYGRAVCLYNRFAKQLINSEFSYLTSIIEIAKDMMDSCGTDSTTKTQLFTITSSDLKEAAEFRYKFRVTLRELSLLSTRCAFVLTQSEDNCYVDMLKFPQVEPLSSTVTVSVTHPSLNTSNKVGQELTNLINTMTPSIDMNRSTLVSSLKKRKSSTSTPQVVPAKKNITFSSEFHTNDMCFTEPPKQRTLTSSLKVSRTVSNSVSKSVKFKLTQYTRERSEDDENSCLHEERQDDETNNTLLQMGDTSAVKMSECKRLFVEENNEVGDMSIGEEKENAEQTMSSMVSKEQSFKLVFEQEDDERDQVENLVEEQMADQLGDQMGGQMGDLVQEQMNKSNRIEQVEEEVVGKELASIEQVHQVQQVNVVYSMEVTSQVEAPKVIEASPVRPMVALDQSPNKTCTPIKFLFSRPSLLLNQSNPDMPFNNKSSKDEMSRDEEKTSGVEVESDLEQQTQMFHFNCPKNIRFSHLEMSSQLDEHRASPRKSLRPEPIEVLDEAKGHESVPIDSASIEMNQEEEKEQMPQQEEVQVHVDEEEEEMEREEEDEEVKEAATEEPQEVEKAEIICAEQEHQLQAEIQEEQSKEEKAEAEEAMEQDVSMQLEEEQPINQSLSRQRADEVNVVECEPEQVNQEAEVVQEAEVAQEAQEKEVEVDKEEKAIVEDQIEVPVEPELEEEEEPIVSKDQDVTESSTEPMVHVEVEEDPIGKTTHDVSFEHEAEIDKTLKQPDQSNESFELNMSSVSASGESTKRSASKSQENDDQDQQDADDVLLPLGPDDIGPKMSRTNSECSLFSHISSVSEQFERAQVEEVEEATTTTTTTNTAKRRRATTTRKAKDDNHVESVTEKQQVRKSTLTRRRSDLSSASSSSMASMTRAGMAALQKQEQQVSTDTKTRLTRSKAKTLTEHDLSQTVRRVTRRNQALEQVAEEAVFNPTQISASNLKKHDDAMEKLETRVTRSSKARSPSPSASSIVSTSTIMSSTANTNAKRRGRKPKTSPTTPAVTVTSPVEDENPSSQEQQPSPTNSVVSVASTASVRSTRGRKKATELLVDMDKTPQVNATEVSVTRSASGRNYNLRSKGASTSATTSQTSNAKQSEDESNAKGESLITRKPRIRVKDLGKIDEKK